MKKICLFFITLLLTFNLSSVFAAGLTLTHIGSLETSGNTYSEWWYTGTEPVLKGTAEASSTVTILVNGEEYTTTADESGNWTFYSESLTEGDHEITLSSGEETYSFTLHLGQAVPSDLGSTTTETTASTGTAVPETGIGQLFALVGGVSAIALGWYFYTSRRKTFTLD